MKFVHTHSIKKYITPGLVIISCLLITETCLAAPTNANIITRALGELGDIIAKEARPIIDAGILISGGIMSWRNGGAWLPLAGAGLGVGLFETLIRATS